MNRNIFYVIIVIFLIGCKGEDGSTGPAGLNSLILTIEEPAGANCEYGGLKVETGLDSNSNSTLEPDEVQKTDYVCNLVGNNSLINIVDEPEGANCGDGGIKVDTGLDLDQDGILDDVEIQITRYLCNGVDGVFDEQIRLIIFNGGINKGTSTAGLFGELIDFDKSFWDRVYSIVFIPKVFSTSETNTAFAELYDLTNDQVIPNSTVSTNSTTPVNLESINIFDDLPSDKIDLAIRLRSENSDAVAYLSGKSYLMLYRKK